LFGARPRLESTAVLRVRRFAVVLAALATVMLSGPPADAQQSKAVAVTVPNVYAAGSIVIVNAERSLYYVTGPGEALRYRVAVGNHEQLWMGRTFVTAKIVDPRWIPVNGDDPIERGEPDNPLGKRALYLDWSLLRIHGTPSRKSIGSAVSNGCVRMLNEDVIDLFERVHVGAPVFAIKSWAEATRFDTMKVAERIHVNPEAYQAAQERLQDEIAMRREWEAEERRYQRTASRSSRANSQGVVWGSSPFGWRW
jgi:hypothetical protein